MERIYFVLYFLTLSKRLTISSIILVVECPSVIGTITTCPPYTGQEVFPAFFPNHSRRP